MPKRKNEDELIRSYKAKIKKLEKKQQQASRRRGVIIYSDSESDFETNDEIEIPNNDESMQGLVTTEITTSPSADIVPANTLPPDDMQTEILPSANVDCTFEQSSETATPISKDTISELDPEIRLALGDPIEDIPIFGDNIHTDLAQRWVPILRKGLTKDVKDKLLKEHNAPDNCRLLKAPSLNPEIAAAVVDVVRSRDKKMELKQNQLGIGITAISKAMSALINDGKKYDIIKLLSEGCRILSDLHFVETKTRTTLIMPCLDRSFLNIIQDEERDDTLFGNNMSEKIKAAKSIEKQGLQIKRNTPIFKKSTSQQQKPRQTGYWSNSPRKLSSANRGGRGGLYTTNKSLSSTSYSRNQPQASSASSPPQAPPQTRQQTANKQRAPMQH